MAYKSTVSAYAFDLPGCLDPDRIISFEPLDIEPLRSPVRAVVCPLTLIDYKDLYRTKVRERNEGEKLITGYPRDDYRWDVILPPYFHNHLSTPQSLRYGSNISESMSFGHFTTSRRVISDTTNSSTKRLALQPIAFPSDHTRKVVIEEVIPSRKKPNQSSTTNKNRSMMRNEREQYRHPSQSTKRPHVSER